MPRHATVMLFSLVVTARQAANADPAVIVRLMVMFNHWFATGVNEAMSGPCVDGVVRPMLFHVVEVSDTACGLSS